MPVPFPSAADVLLATARRGRSAGHRRRRGGAQSTPEWRADQPPALADRGDDRIDDGIRRSGRRGSPPRAPEFGRAMARRQRGVPPAHAAVHAARARSCSCRLPDEVAERDRGVRRRAGRRRRHAARRAAIRARKPRAGAHRLPAQRLHGDVGSGAIRDAAHVAARLPTRGSSARSTPRSRGSGKRCAACPEGTLGREVARFYDARGFAFPGSPGSAPPLLAQHDWVHVARRATGRRSRARSRCSRSSRAPTTTRARSRCWRWSIGLFETGYLATGAGLFEYDRGHLSHEGMAVRLADALRRGAMVGAARRRARPPRCATGSPMRTARSTRCAPSSASSPSRRHAVASGSVIGVGAGRHLAVSVRMRTDGRPRRPAARYDSYGAVPTPRE